MFLLHLLCCAYLFSCVRLFVTPRTVAYQVLLSMRILKARILETVVMPSSRGLPGPGIKPGSPALQVDSFISWAIREVPSFAYVLLYRSVSSSHFYLFPGLEGNDLSICFRYVIETTYHVKVPGLLYSVPLTPEQVTVDSRLCCRCLTATGKSGSVS